MDVDDTLKRLRDVMEPLTRFNFRKGDVVVIPTCQGDVAVEMTTRKGRRVLEVAKSAGAKVRKKERGENCCAGLPGR